MHHAPEPARAVSSPTTGNYKWAVVGMLWLICFFNYADRQAISSILPLLQDEFGFTKETQGYIVSSFMWVYAITAPLAGQVSDRVARKPVILGGLYVWSVITGFTALCSRAWHFIFVRAAEGLGETFYFPASMSLVSDYHDRRTRSRAMSLHQTSVYAGTIGGGALAGWLGQVYGWRVPFVLLGAGGVVLGLVLAAAIREPRRNQAEEEHFRSGPVEHMPLAAFLWILLRTPTAGGLILAFCCANSVGMTFISWLPTFLKEKFALELWLAAVLANVCVQIPSMLGAMLGGVLADRWRARRPGGRILVQALGLLAGTPLVFLAGTLANPVPAITAIAFYGLCKGLYDSNIWASLYDVIPPARRSTAVGLTNMVGWLGGAIGTSMLGILVTRYEVGMSTSLAANAGVYLVAGLLLLGAALLTAPRDIARLLESGKA